MEEDKNHQEKSIRRYATMRNVAYTFIIGLTAGISPFVFIHSLPSLLDPGLEFGGLNYWPLIVTGILIGVITSIIFSKSFNGKDPQQVFFYALGIPAILIGAVSNITTNSQAMHKVSEARAVASKHIDEGFKPKIKPGLERLQEIPLVTPKKKKNSLWINKAWAGENGKGNNQESDNEKLYFVVIGEYENESEAKEALEKIRKKKLRTELYRPKNLTVYKNQRNSYYLIYDYTSEITEAAKILMLMHINDPDLSGIIVRATIKGST